MAVSGVYASNYWYKLDQAWDQSRSSISRQFLNASSLLNSAMTSAMDNQISGTASLAAQAALKRIKAKTAVATTAANSSTATSANKRAALEGSTAGKSGSRISASNYRSTSAASVLSNSNVINFFA
jgi:hypothetical protein